MNLNLTAIRRRFALVHANGVLNQDEEQDVAALCDEVERLSALPATHYERVELNQCRALCRSHEDTIAALRAELQSKE